MKKLTLAALIFAATIASTANAEEIKPQEKILFEKCVCEKKFRKGRLCQACPYRVLYKQTLGDKEKNALWRGRFVIGRFRLPERLFALLFFVVRRLLRLCS